MEPLKLKPPFSSQEIDDALERFFKSQLARKEELLDWVPIDLMLGISLSEMRSSKQFQQIVKEVVKHQREKKKRVAERAVEKVLLIVVGNLKLSRKRFLGYSRSPRSYKIGEYNPHGISYRAFSSVVESLKHLGFIDDHFKAPRSAARARLTSRLKASDGFRKKVDSIEIQEKLNVLVPVLVKNEKKDLVELKRHSHKVASLIENINLINSTLANHTYFVDGEPTHPPMLRRIFNKSNLKLGGRFYSYGPFGYQSLKKKDRSKITINGDEVVELDFKSMHPNLIHALCGLQLDGDAYDLGIDRALTKAVFTIAINCKNKAGAIKAIQNELKIPSDQIKLILDSLLEKHAPIKSLFFTNDLGIKLQYLDSTIAEQVLLKFIQATQGSAILPVHDSFIVQQRYEDHLQSIMKETYFQIMKFQISVSKNY